MIDDWSYHTVKLPMMERRIVDYSNEQKYVEAYAATVAAINELQALKLWYSEQIFGD
jgi:hypothetical protein